MSYHEYYSYFSRDVTDKLNKLEASLKALEGLDHEIKLLESVYYKVSALLGSRNILSDLKYAVSNERRTLDCIGEEIKATTERAMASTEALAAAKKENVELKAKNEALELALEGYVKKGSK